MAGFEDIAHIEAALTDLGGALAERQVTVELCVIGGAAFLLQEPDRYHSTMDIDVAARVLPDQTLTAEDAPPDIVVEVANGIASFHELRPGWINGAAARSFGVTLPEGFLGRAMTRHFDTLTLHIASREDLLKLKLSAAMSRGSRGRRHLDDVRRAAPTATELEVASAWVIAASRNDPSAGERVSAVLASLREAP